MATKNISTYPVTETIKDADKVVLSKDGTVRLVEMGTVKADMRREIRDAKGELQNELNSKTSATEAALDAESTARGNADTNLQTQINDRYTKAETDGLIEAEATARANTDANLQALINNRYTKAETDGLVDAKQDQLSESQLAAVNSGITSQKINSFEQVDADLQSQITTASNNISNEETRSLNVERGLQAQINFFNNLLDGTGPGFHSSIYRGKYLGNTYTNEQKEAIADGSFDDLFVGDYWTINGINWRIADFDYYYNIGSARFTKHHVVIVPDTVLYNARMNPTDTTEGCYTGSEMYTTNLGDARTAFDNAFGESFIPTHKGLYSSSISGNVPSGFTWRDMRVELMNDIQVYGHSAWVQSGYGVGTQKTQFKLFMFDQTKINTKQTYWLESVRSSTNFVNAYAEGNMSNSPASTSYGVRPFACLVGDSE